MANTFGLPMFYAGSAGHLFAEEAAALDGRAGRHRSHQFSRHAILR